MKNIALSIFWQRLAIGLVIISLSFRFINLDTKVYWSDETYTSLRLSGYTTTEMVKELNTKPLLTPQDILKYQQLNSDRSLTDTIKGLALEEAQLPPLYFSLVRFWAHLWGSSITAVRSLSAVVSLGSFPLMYWLIQELCYTLSAQEKSTAGWIGVALLATSPFQLIYAQEARPYALWITTILFSTSCLMRAIRLKKINSWLLYSLSLALGLYTQLLTGLVMIAHSLFIVLKTRLNWGEISKYYLSAVALSLGMLIPWAIIIYLNLGAAAKALTWNKDETPPGLIPRVVKFISNLAGNITRQFVDFNLYNDSPRSYLLMFAPIALGILIIVGYSLYLVLRDLGDRGKLLCCLAIIPWLIILLIDIFTKDSWSSISRYLLPCWLSFQVAVAYLFTHKLNATSYRFNSYYYKVTSNKFTWFWQGSLVLIFCLGLLSCGMIANSEVWWTQRLNYNIPQIAAIVNRSDSPLILSKIDMNLVSLSHRLVDKVRIKPIEHKFPVIPPEFSNIFLYVPEASIAGFQSDRNYEIRPYTTLKNLGIYSPSLWQVLRK